MHRCLWARQSPLPHPPLRRERMVPHRRAISPGLATCTWTTVIKRCSKFPKGNNIEWSGYPQSILVPGVAEPFTPARLVVVEPPSESRGRNTESRVGLDCHLQCFPCPMAPPLTTVARQPPHITRSWLAPTMHRATVRPRTPHPTPPRTVQKVAPPLGRQTCCSSCGSTSVTFLCCHVFGITRIASKQLFGGRHVTSFTSTACVIPHMGPALVAAFSYFSWRRGWRDVLRLRASFPAHAGPSVDMTARGPRLDPRGWPRLPLAAAPFSVDAATSKVVEAALGRGTGVNSPGYAAAAARASAIPGAAAIHAAATPSLYRANITPVQQAVIFGRRLPTPQQQQPSSPVRHRHT